MALNLVYLLSKWAFNEYQTKNQFGKSSVLDSWEILPFGGKLLPAQHHKYLTLGSQ